MYYGCGGFAPFFYGVNGGRAAGSIPRDYAAGSDQARRALAAGSAGLAGALVPGYDELVECGLVRVGVSRGVCGE